MSAPEIPRTEPRAEPQPFWGYADFLLFALLGLPALLAAFLAVQFAFMVLPWRPSGRAAQLLSAQFLGYGLWFLALYALLKLRYGRPFWSSLQWVLPRDGFWKSLVAGPAVALGVAALGAALNTPEIEMPIKQLLTDRSSILLVSVFATTLGPLCEELAFRGFLLPLLLRSLGPLAGVFLTALPFAVLHGPQYGWSWRHLLLITLAGAAFGWVRYRTGSTAAAAVTHASYNLTFLVAYLSQGKDLPVRW